jgi:nitroreductase
LIPNDGPTDCARSYPNIKHATPEWAIADVLARRFSPRAFSAQIPSSDQLGSIFSAAAWAPSAYNGQPWRFLVALHGTASWARILGLLDEPNQHWAHRAPVLGISLAQVQYHARPLETGPYDVGQAMAHLSIQASAIGLYVHQMAGFSVESARDQFGIPDDFRAMTSFAMGYLGSPDLLTGDRSDDEVRPRERRELRMTVFDDRFGEPARWLTDTSP